MSLPNFSFAKPHALNPERDVKPEDVTPVIRSGVVLDCQHMATEAINIGADLARLAAQECAGAPCSAEAFLYIKQRIDGLQVMSRISHEKVAEMDRVNARKVKP